MLTSEELGKLREQWGIGIAERAFVCPRCGEVFQRRRLKNPLCKNCQSRDNGARWAAIKKGQRADGVKSRREQRNGVRQSRINEMRRLRYNEKWSLQDIADRYGISRERVRQVIGNSGAEVGKQHSARWVAKQNDHKEVEAGRYAFAQAHPELTTRELSKALKVNASKAGGYWAGLRHKGSVRGKGGHIEEYISRLLTKRGISHKLTNSRPVDIILADGRTVEIRSRHKPETKRTSDNFYFFPLRKVDPLPDFYVLVVVNGKKSVFVIPSSHIPKSMAVGFCWPQTSKSRGKYVEYLNRFDLLEKGA